MDPFGAGKRLQQGGAAIQQPKNTSIATGWASHGCVCVLGGQKQPGLPLDICPSAVRARWGYAASSTRFCPTCQVWFWVLLACCRLWVPGTWWWWHCWDPKLLLGAVQEPGCVLMAMAVTVCRVLFNVWKYTLEEHYSASVFTTHAQKSEFLRVHQCLEILAGPQAALSSAPGMAPPFRAHKHPFQPSPLKSSSKPHRCVGAGACSQVERLVQALGEPARRSAVCAPKQSPAHSARHRDRPRTSVQHQCLLRKSCTEIGWGYSLERGEHIVSIAPSSLAVKRGRLSRKECLQSKGKKKKKTRKTW